MKDNLQVADLSWVLGVGGGGGYKLGVRGGGGAIMHQGHNI